MKTIFSYLLFFVFAYPTFCQTNDSLQDLKNKIDILRSVNKFKNNNSDRYYKSSEPFHFDYDSLKRVRIQALISVLKDPRSTSPEIQKELLGVVGSPISSGDGKLKIYGFSEWITMATGRYYYNIVQFTTSAGVSNAYLLKYTDCGYTDGIESIYKIQGTNLYLALSSTVWCTTCYNEKAIVFKISDKYLITDYPAFADNKSCLSINTRASDYDDSLEPIPTIDAITYDPLNQELTVQYYTTYPINAEPSDQKTDDLAIKNPFNDSPKDKNGMIKVILKFDGKKFVVKK
jgi:hypothetical protein